MRAGPPTIHYRGYASIQSIYRRPGYINAAEQRKYIAEGYPITDYGHDTDWESLILRTPIGQMHDVTLSGGTSATNYTATVNFDDRQGILIHSSDKIVTGRANVTHNMFRNRLQADLTAAYRIEDDPSPEDRFDYAWRQAIIRNPTDQVYDSTGAYQERGIFFSVNPLGYLDNYHESSKSRDLRLNARLTYRPSPSLSFVFLGGMDRSRDHGRDTTNAQDYSTRLAGLAGSGSRWTSSGDYKDVRLQGRYSGDGAGGSYTLLAGYQWEYFTNENSASDSYTSSSYSGRSSHHVIGFFGRASYDWKDRFLLMGSLRYEGNSRFGANHKWAAFPGLSAGWRLKSNSSWIDDVKLRAGWGVTGTVPNFGLLPDLRWERVVETDVGLDFSLFDHRLAGTVDAYRRNTHDMLYTYYTQPTPGLYFPTLANGGRMRNDGIEAELTWDVVRRSGFRWRTGVNGSHNSNEVVSLLPSRYDHADCFDSGYTGGPMQWATHRTCAGGPIGNFYGFRVTGVTADGYWIVVDSTGNQVSGPYSTLADASVLGNGIPKYNLAWNNTVTWGRWDLRATMRGAFAFQILNFDRMFDENASQLWLGDRQLRSAFQPAFGEQMLNEPLALTSYYVENGDYWKIDDVTLGYTLEAAGIPGLAKVTTSARIYVTGHNLWTMTGYKGMDPEVPLTSGAGAVFAAGDDPRDKYPTTRSFTLGLNMTF